ncbi:MAG: tail fiber domain-containing protein [Bacteroidota bacterium]
MKNILTIFLSCIIASGAFAQPEDGPPNVGINTITPGRAKLEVIGVAGVGATSGIFGSEGAGISLQRNWPTIGFNQYRDITIPGSQGKYMANGFAAIQYFDPGSGTMLIDMFPSGTANTSTPGANRAMTILANGNFGIRTASANATLTVARGDGIDGTAVFSGTQYWSHFNYNVGEATYIRAGVDGSNVYINRIPSGDVFIGNGNTRVGINTTGGTYTIDMIQPAGVNAISLLDGFGYSWHQQVRHVNVSGHGDGNMLEFYYGVQAKGRFQYWDGNYELFSDRRLKTNIEPLPSILEKISQLKPVVYEMKNDNPNHERVQGFIAQEVKPLFPTLVRQINYKSRSGESIKDFNTMNYSSFGVLAIKALQEQWKQIQDLEKENSELMAGIEKLEKLLLQR